MDQIRQYLLCVCAAAILCGIANGIIEKKGSYSSVLKLITGLILALTVISPLVKIQWADVTQYVEGMTSDADDAVADGEAMAYEAEAAIIKSQTEAYILDKAASMGLNIEVEVTLSSSDPPLPCAVSVKGSVSPYSKALLSQYISEELGISEENQQWI